MLKKWQNEDGSFKGLSGAEIDALNETEANEYHDAYKKNSDETIKTLQSSIDELKDNAEKSAELKEAELKALKSEMEVLTKSYELLTLRFEGQKESKKSEEVANSIVKALKENAEGLNAIKNLKGVSQSARSVTFETKATENYADIGDRDYLGTIDLNIERKPVRRTSILDIFPTRSVNSEYLHYWEEDVVTRDAKFVVQCATSTHNTKLTWAKRTVELAKIRDMVDVCLDMLDDYSFVDSELRRLINESIQLKKESELLLGAAAAATDVQSIDSIASEFNPANPLADFSAATGTPFQDANLEQLVDAMSAQIQIFGQENKWMPDTLVMNFKDFVNYRNLKDADGNKIIHTLDGSNVAFIAGLRIITSPIVPANELYVFDSSKGSILQRQGYTFGISYENNDNFEHETATMKAVERFQFYVRNIDKDAFMKCSDVAAAITAITAP